MKSQLVDILWDLAEAVFDGMVVKGHGFNKFVQAIRSTLEERHSDYAVPRLKSQWTLKGFELGRIITSIQDIRH